MCQRIVKFARETMAEIERLLQILPTADHARKAWESFGEVIVCDSYEEIVRVADEIASEHVQVMTADPDYFLNNMTNYGALFLGSRTNVSYGDKVIGTNHTLPTYGYARTASSLGLADYQRRYTVQELSADGLRDLATTVTAMADAEGLTAHKRAVTIRMDVINQEPRS